MGLERAGSHWKRGKSKLFCQRLCPWQWGSFPLLLAVTSSPDEENSFSFCFFALPSEWASLAVVLTVSLSFLETLGHSPAPRLLVKCFSTQWTSPWPPNVVPDCLFPAPQPECTQTHLWNCFHLLLLWVFSRMTYNPFKLSVLQILPPGNSVIHFLSQNCFVCLMLP